jgi:hypothetical protein
MQASWANRGGPTLQSFTQGSTNGKSSQFNKHWDQASEIRARRLSRGTNGKDIVDYDCCGGPMLSGVSTPRAAHTRAKSDDCDSASCVMAKCRLWNP